jgi:hypothetical protein
MGKSSQAKKNKKLPEMGRDYSAQQNKVHELIDYIGTYFSKDAHTKRDFAKSALAGALEFLDDISGKGEVAREIRIGLLAQIARAATEKADKLSTEATHRPTAFWSERGSAKRYASPCSWVMEHWPAYGQGLVLSDIRDTDRPLYRALIYYRREHGWPADFKLATKREHNDALLEQVGGRVDLRNIEDLPAEARRQKRRLLAAQRYRAGKVIPGR